MKTLLTALGVPSACTFLIWYSRTSRQFRDTVLPLVVSLVLCLPIISSRAEVIRDWCELLRANRHVTLQLEVNDVLMPQLCGEVGMIFSETSARGHPMQSYRKDLRDIGSYQGICVYGVAMGGM